MDKKKFSLATRMLLFGCILAIIILIMVGIELYFLLQMNLTYGSMFYLRKIFFGIMLVIMLLFGVLFERFLIKPYKEVKKILDNFNKGAVFDEIFSLPFTLTPEMEISFAKLQALYDKKESLKLSIEQSKYLALQNQINPHFLYNTLDAIRGDAIIGGMEEVANTIEALSTFFGYSISNLDKYSTLGEEIGNIRDYITIQKYRFGEELQLEVVNQDIDNLLYDFCVPRMILQPIVENAVYHGLEKRDKKGTIRIFLQRTQTNLIIDVIDDGVGMEKSDVNVINHKLARAEAGHENAEQKKKGIALVNVNSRIKLLFGDNFGVCVYSTLEVGTDVRITLPIVKKDDMYEKRILES